MSQGTHIDHPFAPGTWPDRSQLEAYLAGTLSPAEAHAVERAMEADPFLREAIEGLEQAEAPVALRALDRARPSFAPPPAPGKGPWFVGGAVVGMLLLAGGWLVLSPLLEQRAPAKDMPQEPVAAVPMPAAPEAPAQGLPDLAEIAAAEEQPEPMRIGHRADERPARPAPPPPVAREAGPEPLRGITPATADPEAPAAKPAKARRPSRKLLFPHDLKLVHPEELYPFEPKVDPGELNVSARFSDRREQQTGAEPQRLMRYTEFMEAALGRFARNEHKACLEDLRFLLEQYPDDVNALFYAGLCSYNLALYARARTFLHRAATHPVDSFEEEATWYHALTLERLGEHEAAREAFDRIANHGGFYAERAKARLDDR